VVETIGKAVGYTGQISLDFVAADDGIVIIECNPRTTDGVLLMSAEQVAEGIFDPERELSMVEPGELVELDFAVFVQMFREPWREMPRSFHDLLRVRDADSGWHDHLPLLYSFLALAHHERLNIHERKELMVAMSEDLLGRRADPGRFGVGLPCHGGEARPAERGRGAALCDHRHSDGDDLVANRGADGLRRAQPPGTTHLLGRAGARARSDRGDAAQDASRNAHWPGRRGQDPSRFSARPSSDRAASRRGVARGPYVGSRDARRRG
jgi:hypothetical protein